MQKPHNELETAMIDHDGDETSDRIARTYIKLGSLLERHKAEIEREASDERQRNRPKQSAR